MATNDDSLLLRRIADYVTYSSVDADALRRTSEEALKQLHARYSPELSKRIAELAEDAQFLLTDEQQAEIGELVVSSVCDNATRYRQGSLSVFEWLLWVAEKETRSWLKNRGAVLPATTQALAELRLAGYLDADLRRAVQRCVLPTRGRPACETVCRLLIADAEGENLSALAKALGIPPGSIHNEISKCRKNAQADAAADSTAPVRS